MKVTLEFESYQEFLDFVASKRKTETPKTHIADSGLSLRTINCLKGEGIKYVEDAKQARDNDLLKIPNLGRHSLREIRDWRPSELPAE